MPEINNMQNMQRFMFNNNLVQNYVNLNRLLSAYRFNPNHLDRKPNDCYPQVNLCNSHVSNSSEDSSRDTSLLKIKESYPNVELLVDTQSAKFPQKVMKILSRSDWSDIISWTPSGKAFRIYDKERLMQVLTPQYFLELTKYENFRRKLYSWGFRILQNGVDDGAWYHKHFIRDIPELCLQIVRTPSSKDVKKKGGNHLASFPSKKITLPCASKVKSSKIALKKRLKCRRDDEEKDAPVPNTHDNVSREHGNQKLSPESEHELNAANALLNLGKFSPCA